jgi:endonuclease-8
MPEGHTVHRMARDHSKHLAGQTIRLCSPQGRFATEAKRLDRKRLSSVTAHGKHLFYRWSNPKTSTNRETVMHVHLGLYGKFRVHKNPPPPPRGAVRVRMIGDSRAIDLNGPTKCEIMTAPQFQKLKNRLGVDPLDRDAEPELAFARISKTKKPIGSALLDQSLIAGIGNIYRAEILHKLKIDPEKPSCQLSRGQFDELWQLTVDLFRIGVKHNKIITVDLSAINKPVSRLTKDQRVMIYKKQTCSCCGGAVKKWTLGARTMYACTKCQR